MQALIAIIWKQNTPFRLPALVLPNFKIKRKSNKSWNYSNMRTCWSFNTSQIRVLTANIRALALFLLLLFYTLGWGETSASTSKAQPGTTSCQYELRKKTLGHTKGQNGRAKSRLLEQYILPSQAQLRKTSGKCLRQMVCTQCEEPTVVPVGGTQYRKPFSYPFEIEKQRSTDRHLGSKETGVHYWGYFGLILQPCIGHFSFLWLSCHIYRIWRY